ncbi:MAG: hypothetical protein K6F33_10340 [Bacteroidales bacterium]|nr:hypothetical protein [Bacteroidales bacterium]
MKRHLLAILLAMLLISCEDVWNGMCGGDYLVNLYNKSADTVFVLTMMGKDTIPLDTTAYTKFWIGFQKNSGMTSNRFISNDANFLEQSLQVKQSNSTFLAITSASGSNYWVAVTGTTFATKVKIFGGYANRCMRILLSADIWDPIQGHVSNYTGGLSHFGIVIPK